MVEAAHGDRKAFAAVYKQYSGYVFNIAYRIVGSYEEAEEVAQDVFLILYRKLETFRFESSFKTWVYRIAVNAALNRLKRTKKERTKNVGFEEGLVASTQLLKNDTVSTDNISMDEINALLNALNEDQRTCIVLRSIEGLSYKEIAETLNLNINTVRTRIKRAREALIALRKEVIKNAM